MADPVEVENILGQRVNTPRDKKSKDDFSRFIRMVSNRPELSGRSEEEIASGLHQYLEKKGKLQEGRVTLVPQAPEYDNAAKEVIKAEHRAASVQKKDFAQQQHNTAEDVTRSRADILQEEMKSWQSMIQAMQGFPEQNRTSLPDIEIDSKKERHQRMTDALAALDEQRQGSVEREKRPLLQEAEKNAQQRQLLDSQEKKKQTLSLINKIVTRTEQKEGTEAANAKKVELEEKYKDILATPDATIHVNQATAEGVRRLEQEAILEAQARDAALKAEEQKRKSEIQRQLDAKRKLVQERKNSTARQSLENDATSTITTAGEELLTEMQNTFKEFSQGVQRLRETSEHQHQEEQSEKQQIGRQQLEHANREMKAALRESVSSGKWFNVWGGHESRRDEVIDAVVDKYCNKLGENHTSLEALGMENEKQNLVRHNAMQMQPKIESFCQMHKHEADTDFHAHLGQWSEETATELASQSNSVMSQGFQEKYPAPPKIPTVKTPSLEQAFKNTEVGSHHRISPPSTSPKTDQDAQKNQSNNPTR